MEETPLSTTAAVLPQETPEKKKRSPSDEGAIESAAKKLRPTENDAKAVTLRKQIEYYFSDENLSRDNFFHSKLSSNAEGWMELKYILSCKKIQVLKATQDDIFAAVEDSTTIETKVDGDDVAWIRRVQPLPPLSGSQKAHAKNKKEEKKTGSYPKIVSAIHQLGIWLKVMGIPEEVSWAKIKEVLNAALQPEQGKIRQVSPPHNGEAFVYLRKFPNDHETLSKVTSLHINGVDLSVALIDEIATARKAIETLPPSIARDREREYSKLKAEFAHRPLALAGMRFESLEHLKKCCREYLDATPDDTPLQPNVLAVLRAILEYHPRAAEKLKDYVTITTGRREELQKDPKTGQFPKCFFIERSNGSKEDFSILKCLDVMAQNPPLAAAETSTETAPTAREADISSDVTPSSVTTTSS